MKIKVSVPATSANVGSGFDALGLAVTLYNTVTFEDSEVLEISASDVILFPDFSDQSFEFLLHPFLLFRHLIHTQHISNLPADKIK